MGRKPVAPVQTMPTSWVTEKTLRCNAQYGFIYLNNPKVGCSTVKSSLWTAIDGKGPGKAGVHALAESPFDNKPRDAEAVRRAFVFTFVRNPFQRLVSAYLNKVLAPRDASWASFRRRYEVTLPEPVSFDSFVELLAGIPSSAHNPHWRPQHLNILHPFVKPNLLADLHQMDDLLPGVLTRLFGQAKMVQAQKHATTARVVWRDFFKDSGTLRRVLDMYGEDFDAFGYLPLLDADPACTKPPVQSDHAHDGLALLVQFWASPATRKPAVLKQIAAADTKGELADWILARRLLGPDLTPVQRAAILARNRQRIADGPAYLRLIADGKPDDPDLAD